MPDKAASCPGVGNTAMSPPVSAMKTPAVVRPHPDPAQPFNRWLERVDAFSDVAGEAAERLVHRAHRARGSNIDVHGAGSPAYQRVGSEPFRTAVVRRQPVAD